MEGTRFRTALFFFSSSPPLSFLFPLLESTTGLTIHSMIFTRVPRSHRGISCSVPTSRVTCSLLASACRVDLVGRDMREPLCRRSRTPAGWPWWRSSCAHTTRFPPRREQCQARVIRNIRTNGNSICGGQTCLTENGVIIPTATEYCRRRRLPSFLFFTSRPLRSCQEVMADQEKDKARMAFPVGQTGG